MGWGFSLVVEGLPSKGKALGSVLDSAGGGEGVREGELTVKVGLR